MVNNNIKMTMSNSFKTNYNRANQKIRSYRKTKRITIRVKYR